jgi:hypothetical protein
MFQKSYIFIPQQILYFHSAAKRRNPLLLRFTPAHIKPYG